MSEFENKTFLVTGGAGFIGSHITDALIERGGKVTVVDNLILGKPENIHPKATFIRADVAQKYPYYYIGDKIDCVWHEAACGFKDSFIDPVTAIMSNAVGTYNVLDYARKCDAHMVYASVGNIEDRIHPYGISKFTGEQLCEFYRRDYGMKITVLRYFNIYGPRQIIREEVGVIPIFVEKMLRGETVNIHGNGKQRRIFTYISDCVNANLQAYLKRADGTFNVAAPGEDYSINQLVTYISNVARMPLKHRFTEAKIGDVYGVSADITETVKALDWKPTVNLWQGLTAYLKWRGRWTDPSKVSVMAAPKPEEIALARHT